MPYGLLMDLLRAASTTTARELIAGLRLTEAVGDRPRVVAAMVASADGRATVEGRAGGLGSDDDRDVLRELRTASDAILVGTGTLRAERYRSLLDAHQVEHRVAEGREPQPWLCTISRTLDLRPEEVPIFDEDGARVVVSTQAPDDGRFADCAAEVHVRTLASTAPPAVLADLRASFAIAGVACEGGPRLLREVQASGCLDELLLTLAPLLVAGAGPTPLTGPALDPPMRMRLLEVARGEDHLFLRYGR